MATEERFAMPSIDDFINHRWTDAKERMRDLDSGFVDQLESEIQLRRLGLTPPGSPWWSDEIVSQEPQRRLSTEWHRLLEACYELALQVALVQTASDSLAADRGNSAMSDNEIGKRFVYHIRSWCIHATALAAMTSDAIRNTTELYISDRLVGNEMAKHHCDSVYQRVTKEIEEFRNAYVHPKRIMAKEITQGNRWEELVAIATDRQTERTQNGFASIGGSLRSDITRRTGEIDPSIENFVPMSSQMLERLGAILSELEEDIAQPNAPKT